MGLINWVSLTNVPFSKNEIPRAVMPIKTVAGKIQISKVR